MLSMPLPPPPPPAAPAPPRILPSNRCRLYRICTVLTHSNPTNPATSYSTTPPPDPSLLIRNKAIPSLVDAITRHLLAILSLCKTSAMPPQLLSRYHHLHALALPQQL